MRSDRVTIEIWTLQLPLPRVFDTVVGPLDTSHVLVARLADEGGHTGCGYSWFNFPDPLADASRAAVALAEAAGETLSALMQVERIEEARFGDSRPKSKDAAHALSMAAWDLAARRAGRTCSEMWGGLPGRRAQDCYATGLFPDQPLERMADDGLALRRKNFARAKMVPSASMDETIARASRMAEIFGGEDHLAIDAASGWSVDFARSFIAQNPLRLAWIEDPVPHERIAELTGPDVPIASGETCTRMAELIDLHVSRNVASIIIDVQHVGGPVRFLEAARALNALGARIGSHAFSHLSVHLLSCFPDSMPVESLDWWDRLFTPDLALDSDGRIRIRGPGFGYALRQDIMDAHGRRIR